MTRLLGEAAPDSLLGPGRGLRNFLRLRWRVNDERLVQTSFGGRKSWPVLVAWRSVLAAGMVAILVTCAVLDRNGPGVWCTFSYVSLLEEVVAAILLLLCTLWDTARMRVGGVAVVAFEAALPVSAVVVVVFWALLAPEFEFVQFLMHGGNCVLLLGELLIGRTAFVPVHSAFMLLFCVAYFVLVLVPYQAVTGNVIYPGLTDFAAPGYLILTLFGVGVAALLFFAVFLVFSHLARRDPPSDGFVLFTKRA